MKEGTATLTLSAVVPATDSPASLARCVEAIECADQRPEELIVVRTTSAPGPAAARNEGAAGARGDVLVFVDADVVPHPDAFARMRAVLADPSVDGVFGAYDDAPTAPGVVSLFRNLLHYHVHAEGVREPGTFWTGLGAVRRNAFDAVGGFDAERFREPSVEDVDLGLRLAAAGCRIVLDPAIRGTHLKRWSLAEMVRTDALRRALPWTRLILSGSRSASLNLAWAHRLSAFLSVALTASVALRRPRLAAAAVVALVALNARFYRLLLRRAGAHAAVVGIGLHVLHHLAAVAGAGAGVVAHVRDGIRR